MSANDLLTWADPYYPDGRLPGSVREAITRHLDGGLAAHYTDALGLPSLREAIAARFPASATVAPHANQVIVTAGSTTGLYFAMSVLFGRGDEVEQGHRGGQRRIGLRYLHRGQFAALFQELACRETGLIDLIFRDVQRDARCNEDGIQAAVRLARCQTCHRNRKTGHADRGHLIVEKIGHVQIPPAVQERKSQPVGLAFSS